MKERVGAHVHAREEVLGWKTSHENRAEVHSGAVGVKLVFVLAVALTANIALNGSDHQW